MTVSFAVNGREVQIACDPGRTLLEVLREDLSLTGAKDGCGGEGECGACTVLLDGEPVNACLVLVGQVEGRRVETIEGLAPPGGELHPIQRAFVEAGAVQCGYCTPGAVLAARALLSREPDPSEEQIREALAGNLCRCTGYAKMVDAVRRAARELGREA
ncbi:MAG TPA: (2Fe-2S)-binding protein [Anaeromyxobacter sp.]|nr:(2Fe-2S)-binding protein [Anaeromyxobacter sp.]